MKEVTLPPLKVFPLDDANLAAVHSHLLDVLPERTKAVGYVAAGVLVQHRTNGEYRVVCSKDDVIDATVSS